MEMTALIDTKIAIYYWFPRTRCFPWARPCCPASPTCAEVSAQTNDGAKAARRFWSSEGLTIHRGKIICLKDENGKEPLHTVYRYP